MSENALPAVAKSIYTDCKKCAAERYHTVLAHTTATSAKVKCEICGAQKTFRIAKAGAAKKVKAPAVPGAPKAPSKRGAAAAAARKNAHTVEYNNLLTTYSDKDVVSYNMKGEFSAEMLVKHPKFGVGIVKTSLPMKIEVVFEDEVRSLVHNRG